MSRLDDAIENLYVAFADVRKPQSIEGCPCCWSDKDSRSLLSGKLRDAPLKELGIYAWSAMSTIGSAEDYLYFLPQILNLIATEGGWGPDVEVIGRAIHETEPHKWATNKHQALEEYLSAIVYTLLTPGWHHRLDSWLRVIDRVGMDVRPHLHAIEHSTDAVLDFFTDNASDLPARRLTSSCWKTPNDSHDAIVAWFYSPRIRKIIFDAYGYVLPMQE